MDRGATSVGAGRSGKPRPAAKIQTTITETPAGRHNKEIKKCLEHGRAVIQVWTKC